MTTKTTKKAVRKKATKVTKTVKPNTNIVLTLKQAQTIQAYAEKNGKTFKVLNNKINAVANA